VAAATTRQAAGSGSEQAAARRFHRDALGLAERASFAGHAGFDRLPFDDPGAAWHLELTCESGAPVVRPFAMNVLRRTRWLSDHDRQFGLDQVIRNRSQPIGRSRCAYS